jgi:periplasmic protein TonB
MRIEHALLINKELHAARMMYRITIRNARRGAHHALRFLSIAWRPKTNNLYGIFSLGASCIYNLNDKSMEANPIAFRHWEDVVFENRNKSYGAYLLRRAYEKRLLVGVGVTTAVVILLLWLQRSYTGREITPERFPRYSEAGTQVSPPPIIEPTRPPEHSVRQPRTNVVNRPVLVTRDPVIEEEEVRSVTDIASDEGFSSGDLGAIEGTGEVPLVDPTPVIEPPFRDHAEVMPQYEGGLEAMMKFIQKKIRYPRVPQKMGIEGTVYVRFIVNGDGSVSDVQVIKGVHPDYDKEASRVISMLPSWKGGSHNGRPVSVRMVLPIKFNLMK